VAARVVVTGANSGLGLATAEILARTGAEVIAVVRSERKGRDARERIDAARLAPGRTDVEIADLEDLSSVRALADRMAARGHIDAIVHNAGAMFSERAVTGDGLERTYQVHVAAPFLLTHLLLEPLRASDDARVITVTSGGMYAQRLDAELVDSPDRYRPATGLRARQAGPGGAHRRVGPACRAGRALRGGPPGVGGHARRRRLAPPLPRDHGPDPAHPGAGGRDHRLAHARPAGAAEWAAVARPPAPEHPPPARDPRTGR
jgi:NAD(P)-dependent dehydrogenase (short-subunit alcohol dehydrogenase family)